MTKRVRAFLACMAGLATIGLANCGKYNCNTDDGLSFTGSACTQTSPSGVSSTGSGTTGSSASSAFVFGGTTASAGIEGFTFEAGTATIVATTNYTAASAPTGGGGELLVAQGKYLYGRFDGVGDYSQVYGWSIDSTGNLTAISGSPFTLPNWGGAILGSMATNPAGTMLFVGDEGIYQGEATIYVLQIGSGGGLTVAPGSPFAVPYEPGNIGTDGMGKYLYVPALASSISPVEINAYSISSSGMLAAVPGSPFSGSNYLMNEIVGDPSGKYLIGTTSSETGDNNLYVYSIGNAGAITPVSGSPFATVYSPYSIAMQPNSGGNLVYSFSLDETGGSSPGNPLEGYQLDTTTGALTAVAGSPFTSATAASGEFDQSGSFLFGLSATTLSAYQVSSAGSLSADGNIVEGWITGIGVADVP
ncbi:MAG: hypothetical protein WA252_00960 [Candidatus Sulfotelmatobacter sp.]